MKKVYELTKGFHNKTKEWKLNGEGLLCDEGLREFFDIPKDATKIYVTLSDKIMPMSYKIDTKTGFFGGIVNIRLSLPNNPHEKWIVGTYTRLDMFLDREGLTNFYVRLHHE